MNNQNIVSQLVDLAAEHRELMNSFERFECKELADKYWNEFNGMIECIKVVANCKWVDAFDMVIDRMIERENK